jgi:hypothetical protein
MLRWTTEPELVIELFRTQIYVRIHSLMTVVRRASTATNNNENALDLDLSKHRHSAQRNVLINVYRPRSDDEIIHHDERTSTNRNRLAYLHSRVYHSTISFSLTFI